MILIDVNLLVYAKMSSLREHVAARPWLERRLSEITGVGLPWASLLGFIRLTTNPRIFETPLSTEMAWDQVQEWLAMPNVFTPEPAANHPEILAGLLRHVERPAHVPGAHLAALALEYDLVLQTSDRRFSRFSGLRWENPLDQQGTAALPIG